MKAAAWWRETLGRFEDLVSNGGRDIHVFGIELDGGSPKARHQFRSIATAAGRAVEAGAASAGYDTWLALLAEKLQPLSPSFFSVSTSVSVRPKPRTISLSRIDPPRAGDSGAKDARDNGLGDGKKDIDPGALIRAAENTGFYMNVLRRQGNQFEVVRTDYATYHAHVSLGHTNAKCVVHEPEALTSSKPRRRRQSTVREEQECQVIDRVCQASVELSELLEAEVFAEEQAVGSLPDTREPALLVADAPTDEMESDQSRPERSLGRNIDRLRTEAGLSVWELAEKVGVQREAVSKHINKGVIPRPDHLRNYAQVFSAFLERRVTVAELKEPVGSSAEEGLPRSLLKFSGGSIDDDATIFDDS